MIRKHYTAKFSLLYGVLVVPAVLCMSVVNAQEVEDPNFFENKADGWHWYEDPPFEEEIEPDQPNVVVAPSQQKSEAKPKPLSAEWLRTTLPVLRDAAIDGPTEENVAAYFYAQRIMMDKAQQFSDMARQVVNNDPLLDENLRLPFASAAKVSFLQSAQEGKRQIIGGLADTAALWVFYDETCSHCRDQINPINKFADEHNIKIEIIHKQGGAIAGLDPSIPIRKATGQFEELGINFTPSVVMVRPPDGLWIISRGFTSYGQLVDRTIAAANQFGLVSDDQYYAAVPTAKGVLQADAINDTTAIDWDTPAEWVPFIRNAISKTYGLESAPGEENE